MTVLSAYIYMKEDPLYFRCFDHLPNKPKGNPQQLYTCMPDEDFLAGLISHLKGDIRLRALHIKHISYPIAEQMSRVSLLEYGGS